MRKAVESVGASIPTLRHAEECEHSREICKKPGLLSTAMQLVLAKLGGFRRNKKIPDDKVADLVRDIRKAAAAEKRSRSNPSQQSTGSPDPIASPATRVSGRMIPAPQEYTKIDFVEQEKELRQAAHGPWYEWAHQLPQQERPHQLISPDRPTSTSQEKLFADTKASVETINKDSRLAPPKRAIRTNVFIYQIARPSGCSTWRE